MSSPEVCISFLVTPCFISAASRAFTRPLFIDSAVAALAFTVSMPIWKLTVSGVPFTVAVPVTEMVAGDAPFVLLLFLSAAPVKPTAISTKTATNPISQLRGLKVRPLEPRGLSVEPVLSLITSPFWWCIDFSFLSAYFAVLMW